MFQRSAEHSPDLETTDLQVLALSCEIDIMNIELKQHLEDLFQMASGLIGAWNVTENDFSFVFGKEHLIIRTVNNNFFVGLELSRVELLTLLRDQHGQLFRSISTRTIPSDSQSCSRIVPILQHISNLEQSIVLVRKRSFASGGLLEQVLTNDLKKEREDKERRLSNIAEETLDDSLYAGSESGGCDVNEEDSEDEVEWDEDDSILCPTTRHFVAPDESEIDSLTYSASSPVRQQPQSKSSVRQVLDVKYKIAEGVSLAAVAIMADRFAQRQRVSDLNLEKAKKGEEVRLADVNKKRLLIWSEREAICADLHSRHQNAINTANQAFQNHVLAVEARQRAVDEAEESGEVVALLMSGEMDSFVKRTDKTLDNAAEIEVLVKFAESDLARLRSRHLLIERRANTEAHGLLSELRVSSDLACAAYMSLVSDMEKVDLEAKITLNELIAAERHKFTTDFMATLTEAELLVFLEVYHV
jgi:hypothetical protein